MSKEDYGEPPIGCYFDSARGSEDIGIEVISMAIGFGYEDPEGDADRIVERGREGLTQEDHYVLFDVVQEAEDYLNTLEEREYHYWGWYEGDFGLYIAVESAKEDNPVFNDMPTMDQPECPPTVQPHETFCVVNDHGNVTCGYYKEDGEFHEIFSVV